MGAAVAECTALGVIKKQGYQFYYFFFWLTETETAFMKELKCTAIKEMGYEGLKYNINVSFLLNY